MSTPLIVHGTPAYRRMAIALLMAGFSTFGLLYDVQPLLPFFTSRFHIGAANSSLAVSMATGPEAAFSFPHFVNFRLLAAEQARPEARPATRSPVPFRGYNDQVAGH